MGKLLFYLFLNTKFFFGLAKFLAGLGNVLTLPKSFEMFGYVVQNLRQFTLVFGGFL